MIRVIAPITENPSITYLKNLKSFYKSPKELFDIEIKSVCFQDVPSILSSMDSIYLETGVKKYEPESHIIIIGNEKFSPDIVFKALKKKVHIFFNENGILVEFNHVKKNLELLAGYLVGLTEGALVPSNIDYIRIYSIISPTASRNVQNYGVRVGKWFARTENKSYILKHGWKYNQSEQISNDAGRRNYFQKNQGKKPCLTR